jgi:peptide/nickel transport system ATP-binding protein/oligopeptide transport system ATP-binding protein
MSELLEVRNLTKRFPVERGIFKTGGFVDAVKGVSFSIGSGETLALVGESGSGKSTVGKMIQGLIEPTSGGIFFEGRDAHSISRKERAHFVQMIFQDPFAFLNPKLSIGTMLREALKLSESASPIRGLGPEAQRLLSSVGLAENILENYPHQFSGGQRQRLGIARALAMGPRLIVADEPVSALDLSIQSQILNLLMDLKERFGMSYFLISHDLSVVEQTADRILVMREGAIVEEGTVEKVFGSPEKNYTKTLLDAVPRIAV